LLRLGLLAEEALRQGEKSTDPQVREHCRSILQRVLANDRDARSKAFLADTEGKGGHDLAGWPLFRRLAGEDAAARRLFARAFRIDEGLLEAVERDPGTALRRFSERANGLRLRLVLPGADATALDEVVLLLLLACEARLKVEPATRARLLDGLETFSERAVLLAELQTNTPARKLMLAFLRQGPDREKALELALRLGLREAAPWALATALDGKVPAAARGRALLVVGNSGDRGLSTRLQPLLNDPAVVGKHTLAGRTLQAQVRDVALAAAIQLRGEDPAEYGFPWLKAIPGVKIIPSPTCLGFATPMERAAAFQKWQERSPKR
jgi:hypothetical protein